MSSLALNVIVGPGEASLLKRCLLSFNAKEFFDEIVIVNTSLDEKVNDVAKEFTDKVFFFQWESERYPYGDFGGARDFARQNTVSDKIMWLDTDDVCLEQYKDQLISSIKLIKDDQYKDVMIWSMPYAIIIDEFGNPITWFKRERVFDRVKISWKRPVHELMYPGFDMVKNAQVNGMYITHMPMKPTYSSAIRNVKILEHEYIIDPTDTQNKYFLGRDYMYTGKAEQGISILTSIIDDLSSSYEMLYAIAIDLVWFYAYGANNPRPDLELFKKENIEKAESWARLAMSFCPGYAEPCVLLGDVYWHLGEIEAARGLYMAALKKKLGLGKFQFVPMYNEVPSNRLTRVFECLGNMPFALHYITRAYQANPIVEYLARKKAIINYIVKDFEDELSKNESTVSA